MRKLSLILFILAFLCTQGAFSQNREFPNAIHAKLNLIDFGSLYNGNLQVSEGFEFAYFRNLGQYINVGIPFKLGLAKLPKIAGNTATTSLDVVVHLENTASTAKVIPYAFAGAGIFLEAFANAHAQIPFGAGLNFKISPYAFINVQAEFRKALVDNRDNVQLGLGYVYLLHKETPKVMLPTDTDKDGTPDSLDLCPNLPGPASTFGCPDADNDGIADTKDQCPNEAGPATTNGCPDYDNDGIADKDDDCPNEAGTVKGCPDKDKDGIADKDDKCPNEAGPASNQGCPEELDTDKDGVPDKMDDCPTVAGTVKGCPDSDKDGVADKDDKCPNEAGPASNNGCPEPKIEKVVDTDNDGVPDDKDECPTLAGTVRGCPDSDKDGVADKDDKCPTVAGPASNNGCPEVKIGDADNDGVPDDKDKCPNTPGPASNFGCPEVKKETKERLAYVTKAVQFETAKATLKNDSYTVLDEVVGIMRQYPDYKLSISGFTDDRGDDERNLKLSQQRAKACYDYLIFRGIKAERLRSAGFGEARPIASNETAEGRELNRRVEFELFLD
jgi:outer membrane protein OmpA-like peptidoglycan-associated protein